MDVRDVYLGEVDHDAAVHVFPVLQHPGLKIEKITRTVLTEIICTWRHVGCVPRSAARERHGASFLCQEHPWAVPGSGMVPRTMCFSQSQVGWSMMGITVQASNGPDDARCGIQLNGFTAYTPGAC